MRFIIKRMLLIIVAIVLSIILFIFYDFFTETGIGILVMMLIGLAYFILTLLWWRCPHCNCYLWRLSPFATHCPYCGNVFE